MTSDIPCESSSCSSAVHLLQSVFRLLAPSELRSEARDCSRGNLLALSPTWVQSPPPRACTRAETCFYGGDCRRLSAAVRPRWPLQLWEALAAPYWSYLLGWTMTSVQQWRRRLRQHLGELGCNHGRGSPIKCLVDLALNQYKKNKSQFRNLPVRSWPQKRQNTKNVSLAATHL